MRGWTFALALLLTTGLLAGCASNRPVDSDGDGFDDGAEQSAGSDPNNAGSVPVGAPPASGPGDAVVIAVIDSGFNPYHYDFLAAQMPQHLNDDPSDDLPLYEDPAAWLPGHPGASGFASYEALNLNLPTSASDVPQTLHDADPEPWGNVKPSSAGSVHMRWIPGTKVVGYVNFGGGDGFSPNSHGVGTTSVSVGNLHGSCPECLIVFVHGTSEVANRWVESQSWIDLQTNSWGLGTYGRERVYAGSDTEAQRTAIERGQQVFFSAGNGVNNDFITPNPTLLSSQEGPDWIVTVGAVTPGDEQSAYTGAGKPADIANIGSGYPSAGGGTVTANSTFGGTSNATPVTAGQYGRALYELRRMAAGASRIQEAGTIVRTDPAACEPNADCVNVSVTVHQLRAALFGAAADPNEMLSAGSSVPVVGGPSPPVPAPSPEAVFAAFGHGVLTGRLKGLETLDAEVARIVELALGADPKMPQAEKDWFVADSYCRQGIWGTWAFGDHHAGVSLPDSDPQWPLRSYYASGCPETLGTVRTVVGMTG